MLKNTTQKRLEKSEDTMYYVIKRETECMACKVHNTEVFY